MKGFHWACLLVALRSASPALAYEADIHYSTTYVLARAVGWPEAQARTIASANQGVDENQDTVAALEADTIPGASIERYVTGSLRQAEKNLRFHCFSKTRGHAGKISADVAEVISGHFADVPVHDADPRKNTARLIALGVALHCQQDAHSHAGFGGSCGVYPGSCYGHAHQTFLDQVAFRLLGKHLYDPDHPGVSGQRLVETLQGTVDALAAHRSRASRHSVPAREVVALSNALSASGLELPDDVRRECNRHLAGKWLHDYFDARNRTQPIPDPVVTLAPGVAATCRNPSLASATVIRVPEPRFPRLDSDASPYLVRADGTYQLIPGGNLASSSPRIHAHGAAEPSSDYPASKVRIQLSHWSQVLALPHVVR